MWTLAIDSSAITASAALLKDGKITAMYTIDNGLTHSQTLLPMIDHLIRTSGIDYNDIDYYVITSGPGSFTGVRIGISTVKGLAFSRGNRCIGVSTLEAMAAEVSKRLYISEYVVFPVMDARCSNVYNAAFAVKDKSITRMCEERAISIDEAVSFINENNENGKTVVITGDGAKLFATLESENVIIDSNISIAYGAALCAMERLDEAIDANELKPVYLRLPQAERERIEKSLEKNR